MTDPPPTQAIPPSGDPRWEAWCAPVLRLLVDEGPMRLSALRAVRKENGWSVSFVTNAVIWLELEGRVVRGPDGWAPTDLAVHEVATWPTADPVPAPDLKTCGRCGEEFVPAPRASKQERCARCRRWAAARRSHERKCDAWARARARG